MTWMEAPVTEPASGVQMLTVGTIPRSAQVGESEPLTEMLRVSENFCFALFCARTIKVCSPWGTSMKTSIPSEPVLLKAFTPSTTTVISFTSEEEVVPATIRIGDRLEIVGAQRVTDGSTLFSGQ